jgi:hypothetical protein
MAQAQTIHLEQQVPKTEPVPYNPIMVLDATWVRRNIWKLIGSIATMVTLFSGVGAAAGRYTESRAEIAARDAKAQAAVDAASLKADNVLAITRQWHDADQTEMRDLKAQVDAQTQVENNTWATLQQDDAKIGYITDDMKQIKRLLMERR